MSEAMHHLREALATGRSRLRVRADDVRWLLDAYSQRGRELDVAAKTAAAAAAKATERLTAQSKEIELMKWDLTEAQQAREDFLADMRAAQRERKVAVRVMRDWRSAAILFGAMFLVIASAMLFFPLPAKADPVADAVAQVRVIEHAAFCMERDGVRICADPGNRGSFAGLPPADVIVITHCHSDHLRSRSVDQLRGANTIVIGPACARGDANLILSNWMAVNNLGPHEDLVVQAVPMFNTGEQGRIWHPEGAGNGYVITWGDGLRVYIQGDSSVIPDIGLVDIAFICIRPPFCMSDAIDGSGTSEAGRQVAAGLSRRTMVIPYHYGGDWPASFEAQLTAMGQPFRRLGWY